MPNSCRYIEDVEFEPMRGELLHFAITTGDERLRFCMSKAAVMRAAYDAIATASEPQPEAVVIPILGERPVEYSALG